jgi:choline kinase
MATTGRAVDGNIIELGKKPGSYYDIEGQYIGLIKISKSTMTRVTAFYESLDKGEL